MKVGFKQGRNAIEICLLFFASQSEKQQATIPTLIIEI
jgi:hypothetical protein